MTLQGVVQAPSGGRKIRLWRALVLLSEMPGVAGRPTSRSQAAPPPARSDQAEHCVFEFDEAYTAFVDGFDSLPSESQMLALQAVDSKVASMVARKDASLWTDVARRSHSEWVELRALASSVLVEFDWPDRIE